MRALTNSFSLFRETIIPAMAAAVPGAAASPSGLGVVRGERLEGVQSPGGGGARGGIGQQGEQFYIFLFHSGV